MKGRRAKKGAVLATAVVFMTIIIALSVLVVVFASSSTKRAVNAAKRANSSIEMNLIADEFVTSVKDGHESYYKVDSTTSEEENGAGTETIRELPVATIDAHMNEFAQKINENYSCEVSVSASKTYSLKLIETSGEKKTQIMIVSVDVKEVKDKNDADKVIGYTYSVVKWNTTSQTVEEPNVGDVTNEQIMKLAQKFLQLYISENKDSSILTLAMSNYIKNETNLNDEKFDELTYYVETQKNGEIDYNYVKYKNENDEEGKTIFIFRIEISNDELKDPSFVIYDNETLNKEYGFVVTNNKKSCIIYMYKYDSNNNPTITVFNTVIDASKTPEGGNQ